MEIKTMIDTRQTNEDTRSMAPLIGFALGALVGGGLALLLAPASGEKTRRRLGEAARKMTNDTRHTIEDASDAVTSAASGLGSDVKSAIEAGREALQHDGKQAVSRIAQALNPPSHTP
jgi:gas vesicle protein